MTLRLGLRLAVAGGREAMLRLVFTAVGVGVGVALLLLALTAPAAAGARAERSAWHHAAMAVWIDETPDPPVEAPDGALFLVVSDYYDGIPMNRAYVAALGPHPPVPRGLDRLPGPGEVAASPAMRRLLEATPDDQLDDRFPGRVTLTIGKAGLAHDNELVAIIGRTPEQMRAIHSQSLQEVHGFYSERPGNWAIVSLQQGALGIATVLVLVPVIILIVTVTRVAATQREQRLATLRLVGATRMQTAVVAAAETGAAALAGTVLGSIGYQLGRRILAATVTFQYGHFWVDDVAVGPRTLAVVAVGVPALVVLATILSLRRVQATPLSTSRRGVRLPPSAWSGLPLALGVLGIFFVTSFGGVLGTGVGQLGALFSLLAIVGMALFGPWVCMLVGQGIARVSRGAPGLIAARRIAVDPRATFRAVIGVVLAAAAVTYLGTTVNLSQPPGDEWVVRLRPGVVHVMTGGVSQDTVAPLLSSQAVTVRSGPAANVASCEALATVRYLSCPGSNLVEPGPNASWLSIIEIYIPTDGSLAAENRVRTQAANLVPNAIINTDRDPVDYHLETFLTDFDRLGSIAGLFVLLVGACSLVASMVGALIERRRPFALLRAAGVPLRDLRRVVLLETAGTMLLTSVLGVALGLILALAAAQQSDVAWKWPTANVYGYVAGGVLAAALFSTLALPLLNATTRHDAVRHE